MTKASSTAAAIVDNNNNNDKKKKNKKMNNNKGIIMGVVKKEEGEEDDDNDELLSEDDDNEEEYKSRCDVLKRRSKRLKKLSKIYTDHYWSLIEHLKLKHTDFLWNFAKTPYASSSTSNTIHHHQQDAINNNNNGKVNANNVGGGGGCEMHSCKKKAMALTRFCHTHILADPKQILYKPCTYAFKSSPSGPTLCMKPILKSAVPSLCSNHLEKAEKHLSRSLRKEGFTGNNKCPPKFNVIVSEFVRQIQSDRKESL